MFQNDCMVFVPLFKKVISYFEVVGVDIVDKLAVTWSPEPGLGAQVQQGRVWPRRGPQDVHLGLQDVAGTFIFNLFERKHVIFIARNRHGVISWGHKWPAGWFLFNFVISIVRLFWYGTSHPQSKSSRHEKELPIGLELEILDISDFKQTNLARSNRSDNSSQS